MAKSNAADRVSKQTKAAGKGVGKSQCTHCCSNNNQELNSSIEFLVGGPYTKNGKKQPYGHVALRVIREGKDITYDYGRYGQAWGIGKSEGEGMLRVWTNFSKYIKGEKATGRTTKGYTFNVSDDDAKKVIEFFESKIKGVKPNQDRGYMKQFHINKYDALESNCTTISVDGAKPAKPSIMEGSGHYNNGNGLTSGEKFAAHIKGWPNKIFMPADLGKYLSNLKGCDTPNQTTTYNK
jgi:hypothetical protein